MKLMTQEYRFQEQITVAKDLCINNNKDKCEGWLTKWQKKLDSLPIRKHVGDALFFLLECQRFSAVEVGMQFSCKRLVCQKEIIF